MFDCTVLRVGIARRAVLCVFDGACVLCCLRVDQKNNSCIIDFWSSSCAAGTGGEYVSGKISKGFFLGNEPYALWFAENGMRPAFGRTTMANDAEVFS